MQVAGSGGNTVSADNNGSVMKRCIMLEDINQELAAHYGIHINTCGLKVLQGHLLLQHNQCTGLCTPHFCTGLYNLIDGGFRNLVRITAG